MKPEEKKKRTATILPTQIDAGDGLLTLAEAPLSELAKLQADWKEKLANAPLIELQLRAINAEIRKRAK